MIILNALGNEVKDNLVTYNLSEKFRYARQFLPISQLKVYVASIILLVISLFNGADKILASIPLKRGLSLLCKRKFMERYLKMAFSEKAERK